MRKFKKITSLLLIGTMCVAIAACGKKDNQSGVIKESDDGSVNEIVVTTPAYKNDVAVADIEAAVAAALGEDYYAAMPMESLEMLEITEDMYTDFVYKIPMINVNVDTLIIVKAAEGKVADVEAKLNQFRDNNINDLMQYPMNLTKIQCSQVVTYGDYVVFVQLGADKGMLASESAGENASEDEIVKLEMDAINEQNQIALDAIEAMLAN